MKKRLHIPFPNKHWQLAGRAELLLSLPAWRHRADLPTHRLFLRTGIICAGWGLLCWAFIMAVLPVFAVPPADNTVVYSRRNATNDNDTIWFGALNGTSDTLVTTGLFAHISLDRNFLVFTRNGYRGSAYLTLGDVWIRNLSANSEENVFANNYYVSSCDFIRDGTQFIVPYRCGELFRFLNGNPASGFSASLDFCTDALVVNPVDGRIAFHDLSRAMALIIGDPDAQNKVLVPNTRQGRYPHWSSDGEWLSFTIQTDSQNGGFNLYKIKPDGTGRQQLTFFSGSTNGFERGAAWSPDGNALIGAANINGTNGLYRVAADGSGNATYLNITQPGDPIFYVGAVVGSVPPLLKISLINNQLVLSWPTNPTGFQLQSASTPLTVNSWLLVPDQPVVAGHDFYLTNQINQTGSFYRLKR